MRGVLDYIISCTAPRNPSMRGWLHRAQNPIYRRCAGLSPGISVGCTAHRILSMRGVLDYIITCTAPRNPSMRGWLHRAQNPIHARSAGLYDSKLYYGNPVGCTAHRILSMRGVLDYMSSNYITAPSCPHRSQNPNPWEVCWII